MRGERGQATVEWVGLVLLVAGALGAVLALGPDVDGRSLPGFLSHRIVCAVRGGCDDGDALLARAYGRRRGELVRRVAPDMVYEPGERSVPVDWRECRSTKCSRVPDDRGLDAHRTDAGRRATVFTRLVRRGGRVYVEYWFYYPDSNTTLAHSDFLWNHSPARLFGGYPGFHEDDWEGFEVRVDPDGSTWSRATAHGHWQACKQRRCKNRWLPATGWTRVSRGSHAGHIPLPLARERTSTAEGIRLVPLETIDRRSYRPQAKQITPPWLKDAWRDPEHGMP